MEKGFIDKNTSIENNFFKSTKPIGLKADNSEFMKDVVKCTFKLSGEEITEMLDAELNRLFVQAMKLKGELK